MTPQPMSDAEIAAMLEKHAGGCEWSDDEYESAEWLVAKAMAARDAQWREMLGEPVAWEVKQGTRTFLIPAAEFKRMSFDAASFSPLYAIKETP